MAVLREWRCVAHNHEFESTDERPGCPFGCSAKFVVLEFRTPPSIRHSGTTTTDILQNKLAADYGLTNMRNDRDASVMASTPVGSGGVKHNWAPHQLPKWSPGLFPVQDGWAQRAEAAPVYNHEQAGLKGTNMPVKPLLDIRPKNLLRRSTVFQKPK